MSCTRFLYISACLFHVVSETHECLRDTDFSVALSFTTSSTVPTTGKMICVGGSVAGCGGELGGDERELGESAGESKINADFLHTVFHTQI